MSEFDMRLLIEELQERNDNLNKENNELSLENQRLYNLLDKIKEYIKGRTEFGEYDHAYPGILNQDEVRHINRLLEEIE